MEDAKRWSRAGAPTTSCRRRRRPSPLAYAHRPPGRGPRRPGRDRPLHQQGQPRRRAPRGCHLLDRIELLADEPHRGRAGRWPHTRELVVPPYVIPYRVKGQTVEVLRVFHGAREWPDRPRPDRSVARSIPKNRPPRGCGYRRNTALPSHVAPQPLRASRATWGAFLPPSRRQLRPVAQSLRTCPLRPTPQRPAPKAPQVARLRRYHADATAAGTTAKKGRLVRTGENVRQYLPW